MITIDGELWATPKEAREMLKLSGTQLNRLKRREVIGALQVHETQYVYNVNDIIAYNLAREDGIIRMGRPRKDGT